MLAEIYFLRLEAMLRSTQEAVRTQDARLVPLPAMPLRASEKPEKNGKITSPGAAG
jgi:hypothetical protein